MNFCLGMKNNIYDCLSNFFRNILVTLLNFSKYKDLRVYKYIQLFFTAKQKQFLARFGKPTFSSNFYVDSWITSKCGFGYTRLLLNRPCTLSMTSKNTLVSTENH